ncbi:MAG: NUDIX hydrolase [Flavobacteriales bacterium]|nr:NUDIX hydrolase [Flavobacteriales bacterium]|tara:strand:- start:10691 stop:11152 length:462 start_codon:yes stop_codon:yes gene_type:complete
MQKYKVYNKDGTVLLIENFDTFCRKFITIYAAGGIVYNNSQQILMIFRNNFWDLPKGKLELNEKIEDCAIREVEEETGVKELIITSKMPITYHTYELNNKPILKCTYWFKMFTDYSGKLKPQVEEGISNVVWVNKIDVANKKKQMYPNIKELL